MLGLSSRARSIDARAGRDRRPAPRQRRARAHAIVGGARRSGWREVVAAGRGRRDDPSAVQVFPRGRRGSVSLVSWRPARRQGIAAGRARRPDGRAARVQRRCGPHALDGRNAARLDRRARRARSGSLSRPHTRGWMRSRATCGGAGITTPRASSGRSTRRCGAPSITIRSPCSGRYRPRCSKSARRRSCCTAASTTRTAACRNTSRRHERGARGTLACSGRDPWRISRPSSACTNRFRFIQGASAFSPAITSRRRPISAFRSWASGCTTVRDISRSDSICPAISRKTTATSTAHCCRSSPRETRAASR